MTGMTGAADVASGADAVASRRGVFAVVAAVVCVAVACGVVVYMSTTRTAGSVWQAFPPAPGEVAVAEQSGRDDDLGYDFWVRMVESPALTGPQLTADYADRLTQAGWTLLASYPALDGQGFSRVCLATDEDGDPRLADIRFGAASGSQLADRVEIAVSRRPGDRSVCGDVFGQFTWDEASKPAR
jgi:hypothetical protein